MRDLVEPRSWSKYGSPDDKRSRTFMTTSGMKTFRLQPTVNNSTLSKYQMRSDRIPSPSLLQPLAHSTPVPPHIEGSQIIRSSSCKLERNYSKSLKNSSKIPPLGSSRSTPSPVISSSNPESRHTTSFTVRSASCTPSHLYMAEHVRAEAKLRQAARPHSCSRQNVKRNKTPDDNEIPDQFGEPVTLPTFVKSNPHLKHSQLSMGQKQYLWGIARIYSVDRLKKLKQRQYQGLLDYEFKKRLEKMDLKERERVKEVKDYLRYTKFINTYEQRIPRNLRSSDSPPCEVTVANHIHKHVVKGWTTKVDGLARYREGTLGDSQETLEEVDSNVVDVVKSERGRHIYKHVIKGWTMDPRANDAFQLNNAATSGDEEEEDERREISLSEPENTLEDDVSIYKVEISKSSDKNHEEGEVMRITGNNGEVSEISVSLQDSTITESNFL